MAALSPLTESILIRLLAKNAFLDILEIFSLKMVQISSDRLKKALAT